MPTLIERDSGMGREMYAQLRSCPKCCGSAVEQRQPWTGEYLLVVHALTQSTREGHLLGPHYAKGAPLASSPVQCIACQASKGQPVLHVVLLARGV